MADDSRPVPQLHSQEVRGIQMMLFESIVTETLTMGMLEEYQKYLDMDIKVLVCEACTDTIYIEECVSSIGVSQSSLEEHLNLIQNGYCFCEDEDIESKNKTIGLRIIHLLSRDNSNLPFLKYLTKKQLNLNANTFHNKDTALLIAVALEQTDIIKHLIEHGAEVNKGEEPIHRIAPLILAAIRQKKGSFEALLTSKMIDLDILDSASSSLLYICARLLPIECMKRLLEAGANPNITDKYGRTTLLLCCANRQHDLMKLLIEHGADVNKKNPVDNDVPMLQAVQTGDVAAVTILLEAGADANYCCQGDNKSLILKASSRGYTEIIKLLIKHGGDVNIPSSRRCTAIHLAAWNGHVEIVKTLIAAGAQHDEPTIDGNTPLGLAAYGSRLECMEYLLALGCRVNNRDRNGDTALFYAANNGLADGVKILLENGADPDVCDNANASVLWTAVFKGQKDIVRQLLIANAKMEIASKGMDSQPWTDQVFYFYDNPKSPLYVAVVKDNLDIAVMLLNSGYNLHNETWLLGGNIPETDKSAELIKKLTNYMQLPLSLYDICRNYFRTNFGRELQKKVDELSLPTSVKNYLTLKP